MRAIALRGEMDHDYVVCPITPEVEAALPALSTKVQQWADAEVELEELSNEKAAELEAVGLLHRADTAEDGLAMATNWVDATNPDAE